LADKAFARVLMTAASPVLSGVASLLKRGVSRTYWKESDLTDWEGRPLLTRNSIKVIEVEYRRSDEEISLLKRVLSLTRGLSATSGGQQTKKILLRQAGSSFLVLEQTVRRLRNVLAHGLERSSYTQDTADLPEQGSAEADSDLTRAPVSTRTRSPWKNSAKALSGLHALVAEVENISTDSKREALERLLARVLGEETAKVRHVCVACSYRVTAKYVASALSVGGEKPWLLTSDIMPDQFKAILDEFENRGGVLICTAAALLGTDLRYIQAMIHYDPPTSDAEMWARVSRNPEAINYVLTDSSNVLPAPRKVAGRAPDSSRV
jgi:hypothetical protein